MPTINVGIPIGSAASGQNAEVSDTTGDCAKTGDQNFMVIYQQVINPIVKTDKSAV